MPGIFISRGMRVAIPAGALTISLNKPSPAVTLHVHFDVCPSWCQLATSHMAEAKARASERMAAWAGNDESAKAHSLEREFEASMQAIMAAAIAVDAFYAVLQTHVALPPSLVAQWRTKRTSRHSQVTEVLRRGFHLKPKGVAKLREYLKEIYRFRDLAVHPSGKIEAPLLHPELDVGVEWRFAYFRASNAESLVNAATGVLWDLANNAKPTDKKIIDYIAGLRPRLSELFPSGHPLVKSAPPPP
jgi:hypothetical protein